LIDEINRCALLGISQIVLHPGAHMGDGYSKGVKTVSKALNDVLDSTEVTKVKVLLETTAGQGTCIGHRFEHIAEIIEGIKKDNRIGVCIDTCHIFAAGYDIRKKSSFEKVFREFDSHIGMERLACFHMNDSKGDLGSRLDRHEHIGKGKIGEQPFRTIVRAKRFKGIPKIIETPGGVSGGPGDLLNIELLFSFAN